MRLLRTADLTFEDIPSRGPFPEYAILSHTWITPNNEEVTFQDILSSKKHNDHNIEEKAGWSKIISAVEEAKRQSLDYIWIDTCCINKEDPAELSEAINCMYNWYSQAAVCYAYISDARVTPRPHLESCCSESDHCITDQPCSFARRSLESHTNAKSSSNALKRHSWELHLDNSVSLQYKRQKRADSVLAQRKEEPADDDVESFLRACRWVQRGWTLQELLAPPTVHFYDALWTPVTTRSDSAAVLSRITGIDEGALYHRPSIQQYSVAQRMCWAADRQTTKAEDKAYSLLGLFGVMMPLFYGEGEKSAFRRLQHEIIKASSDQSLFAWVCSKHAAGLLARDPDCFKTRSHIIPRKGTSAFRPRRQQRSSAGYFLNNRGLQISLPLLPSLTTREGSFYQAILNCRSVDDPGRIFLLNLYHVEDNEYCVIDSHQPRCTDIDWWRLPARRRTDAFEK